MPITIDGNKVGAVSIDDVDVGEITMDGQTVWSSGYKVFTGGQAGYLDALYPVNSRIWRIDGESHTSDADTTWDIAANPANGVIYAGVGTYLFKINYEGNVKWYQTEDETTRVRGIATYGNYVYAGLNYPSDSGVLGLFKYDSAGNKQWDYNASSTGEYGVREVACDNSGNAYANMGFEVHKLDASKNVQWTQDLGELIHSLSLGNNYLWVGSYEHLYALSKSDGGIEKGWSDEPVTSSPLGDVEVVVGPDNYLYFATYKDDTIIKSSTSGSKQWQYELPDEAQMLTISPDKELYVADRDGGLKKLDGTNGNLIWTYSNMPNDPRSVASEQGTRKAFPTYW